METENMSLNEEERGELKEAFEGLSRIFTANTGRMSDYKKRLYMPAIQKMCEENLPAMKSYHSFCKAHPERAAAAASETAAVFMGNTAVWIEKNLSGKKLDDRIKMEQYRMVMAAFVIPCMKEMKAENGQALIDRIMELWASRYPSYPFQQTDAATLQKGFKLTIFG